MPRIRSERPAFELHYPHLVERLEAEAHAGRRHKIPLAATEPTGGATTDGALGEGCRAGRDDPDPT